MSEPLTDAEIVNLRQLDRAATTDLRPGDDGAIHRRDVTAGSYLGRLLDELESIRRRDREQAAGEEVLRQQLRDAERKIEMLRGMESLLRDAITVLGSIGEYEGMFPGADVDKKDEVARLFAAFPEWAWDGGPKLPAGT